MNDDFKISMSAPADPELPTMGMSSVYRLFEAFIALREKNAREHKLFEQTLNRTRDSMQASFNSFAGDTQKAYQQLRQDILGEKKFSLTLLNVLLRSDPELPTMGMSSVYRLFEAFIALREKNAREHKLFEQTLNRTRDSMQASFNSFAGDTQKAYQQLRQDILGEKKFSLTLLNVLL